MEWQYLEYISLLLIVFYSIHRAQLICIEANNATLDQMVFRNMKIRKYSEITTHYRVHSGDNITLTCPSEMRKKSRTLFWFYTNQDDQLYKIYDLIECFKNQKNQITGHKIIITKISLKEEGYYICSYGPKLSGVIGIMVLQVNIIPTILIKYTLKIYANKMFFTVYQKYLQYFNNLIKRYIWRQDNFRLYHKINVLSEQQALMSLQKLVTASKNNDKTRYNLSNYDPSSEIELYDLFVLNSVQIIVTCMQFDGTAFVTKICFNISVTVSLSRITIDSLRNIIKLDQALQFGSIDKFSIWFIKELVIIGKHRIAGGVWIINRHGWNETAYQQLPEPLSLVVNNNIQYHLIGKSFILSELITKLFVEIRRIPLLSNLKSEIKLSIYLHIPLAYYINITWVLVVNQFSVSIQYDSSSKRVSVESNMPFSTFTERCLSSPLQLFIQTIKRNLFILCDNIQVALIYLQMSSAHVILSYQFSSNTSCSTCFVVFTDVVGTRKYSHRAPSSRLLKELFEVQQASKVQFHRQATLNTFYRTGEVKLPKIMLRDNKYLSVSEKISIFQKFLNTLLSKHNGKMTIQDISFACPSGQELESVNDNWYCYSCLPGSFYNNTTKQCTLCKPNQYQFSVRSTACNTCPENDSHREFGMDSKRCCMRKVERKPFQNIINWINDIAFSNETLNSTRVTETGYDWRPSVRSITLMFCIILVVIGVFMMCVYYTTVKIFMKYVDL